MRAFTSTTQVSALGIVVVAALTACAVPSSDDGGATSKPTDVSTLSLRPVDWNPAKADLGTVAAVTEVGDQTVLFGSKGATVLRGGAIATSAAGETTWVAGTSLPAADGIGTWIVGVDGAGHLRRVRSTGALEDVSDRYGLDKDRVQSVVTLDGLVAFGFESGFALADGTTVTRYDTIVKGPLSAARTKLAWVGSEEVRTFDIPGKSITRWPLPEAAFAVLDDQARLVVATKHALWTERDGMLRLRWTANDSEIHGMTSAGTRIWFAVGSELGVLEGDALARSSGAAIDSDVKLSAAKNGDVWALSAKGMRRFARDASDAARLDWDATIQPIFARVCSACHQPGGTAGVDLSSYDAWMGRRPAIRKRVVVDKTMPPASKSFSETDRAAIASWLDRNGG